MNQRDQGPMGLPGGKQPADTDALLGGVEHELATLDDLSTTEQVPVFDRMHSALAESLARTADTGGQPVPGGPGA